MNKTKLFIVSILLILIHSGYSQDILKNKTFAVIDTSKCKLEQAHQIYTWITKNIAYDVKAFLKGNSKIKSAQDIIKKKKGICVDYSLLFNEMCNQAGIEVSTVSGYSKGADYYKGGGFYRADHCWNVIYVDTLWYLVDPTWGSGYVKRIPTQLDKIKYFLFKIPYVNKKLIFVKSPTDIYFNMLKAPFSRKHMPLDPKWQLEQYPFTIKSFENDTLKELGTYLNYKQEIINSKGLSVSQQLYTEGLNGKTFNKKNDFDIAYGLLSIASEFNDEATKVDSLTKPLFKTNLFYYQNATKYISHYKVVNDSVFSQRLNFLKKESYNGKKIVVNLKRKLKMEQGLYFKQQENLDKKNNSLTQKIDRLGKLIEVESQRNYYRFPTGKVIKSDTSIINLNLRSLKKSIIKSFSLKKEIDSLFIKNNENLQLDSVFSLECILKIGI